MHCVERRHPSCARVRFAIAEPRHAAVSHGIARDVRMLVLEKSANKSGPWFVDVSSFVHYSLPLSRDCRNVNLHCCIETLSKPLQGPTALKYINHYHHERDDQKNVNDSAQCVRGDQTEQPKDQQDYNYGPKHFRSSSCRILRRSDSFCGGKAPLRANARGSCTQPHL